VAIVGISKRLRYEILRRDNHSCRYCGGTAPDVKLTVDHVLPVALGGSDDPGNLVAACKDCNAGKSSAAPDSELVSQIADSALLWAKAVELAAEVALAELKPKTQYVARFDALWTRWYYTDNYTHERTPIPRPLDWANSISGFYARGLPIEILEDAAGIALARPEVAARETWRYCMGIAWKRVDALQTAALEYYDEASAVH
jgi:hypothetical protein